jgi:hypothetical protein
MTKGKKKVEEQPAQEVVAQPEADAAVVAAQAEAAKKAEEERAAQEQAEAEAKAKEAARREAEESAAATMNALALRIWDGQSISLPLVDRVTRIKAALIHHGYQDYLGSLSLPADGFEKYL